MGNKINHECTSEQPFRRVSCRCGRVRRRLADDQVMVSSPQSRSEVVANWVGIAAVFFQRVHLGDEG